MLRSARYKPGMTSDQGVRQLAGKVAAITGASMGIGEATAKLFADHGARVVLLSRDAGRVEAARARIGHVDRTLALACDVRNREEIDRAIGLAMHHCGRIDIWVNNAGHGILDSVAAANMAAVRETFDTNFFGTLESMQAVIPIMKPQGGGTIVNISSVAGHIPLPYHAIYSATKFAMNALGKGARIELADFGINLLTVCPGYVNTPFAANALRGSELKQIRPRSAKGITADRVARAVLDGYLKGKREVIVPWTMIPVVKIYQLFPGLVEWSMRRMAKNGH
jgi:short-subunit dehydrogenase